MPETIENEAPNPPVRKRNERTEAKFLEDADKLISEAERLGADYNPPNDIAKLVNLKAKRTEVSAQRTVNQANDAAEETARNRRENLFKPLNGNVTSLVEYTKSAGIPPNELDALKSIARDIKGTRAKPVAPDDGNLHISVANLSFASRADNFARFIEQYAALGIETTEDIYNVRTHRTKLGALRQATTDVIAAESAANTSGEQLDKLAYTDPDSLLNSCISAKSYIKSKYKTTGEPYKNIAKTRFELPSRLRK